MRCAASNSTLNTQLSTLNRLKGLRVCLLAGTLGQGGAERQLFYNLKCLTECGAEVNLLCLTKGEHWEEPIRKLGIPVEWVGESESRFARLFAVIKAVRRLRPNVVQSQHAYANTYASIAARVGRCQDIGAVRGDGMTELKANGPLFGRLHLRLPRVLAVNSRAAIRNLTAMGIPAQRLVLLPNVIDTDYFQPEARLIHSDFLILGIGRLVREKRFDLFLKIIARLRNSGRKNVKGLIIGGGPLKPQLEALAQELGLLPEEVSFHYPVSDIRPHLRHADVFLLSSDHEGTPNVVMEAMACGLLVVATNVGGVADLVKNGETGFLFEPGDTAGALVPLERLASEPTLAAEIGQRARAFIEKHHSVSLLPEILAGLYDTISR